MQVNVVRIGNSKGIRIPKKVLDQCQVDKTLELSVQDNVIMLTPMHKKPREGWAEAAKLCHERGDDTLLIPDVLDDDPDWEW